MGQTQQQASLRLAALQRHLSAAHIDEEAGKRSRSESSCSCQQSVSGPTHCSLAYLSAGFLLCTHLSRSDTSCASSFEPTANLFVSKLPDCSDTIKLPCVCQLLHVVL